MIINATIKVNFAFKFIRKKSPLQIITTRQTGGLLLAYKAKGLKPRLKSHAFTYVQAYCSLSPAGP